MSNITEQIEREIKLAFQCFKQTKTVESVQKDLLAKIESAIQRKETPDPSTGQSTSNWQAVGDKDKFLDEVRGKESDVLKILKQGKVSDVSAADVINSVYKRHKIDLKNPQFDISKVNEMIYDAMHEYAISETYDALDELKLFKPLL